MSPANRPRERTPRTDIATASAATRHLSSRVPHRRRELRPRVGALGAGPAPACPRRPPGFCPGAHLLPEPGCPCACAAAGLLPACAPTSGLLLVCVGRALPGLRPRVRTDGVNSARVAHLPPGLRPRTRLLPEPRNPGTPETPELRSPVPHVPTPIAGAPSPTCPRRPPEPRSARARAGLRRAPALTASSGGFPCWSARARGATGRPRRPRRERAPGLPRAARCGRSAGRPGRGPGPPRW